jgi:serine/threonine protein kinase
VREDPLREIRVMRYLNDVTYLDFPGFHSIARLLHVLQDDSHLYLVLEYYAGVVLSPGPVQLRVLLHSVVCTGGLRRRHIRAAKVLRRRQAARVPGAELLRAVS